MRALSVRRRRKPYRCSKGAAWPARRATTGWRAGRRRRCPRSAPPRPYTGFSLDAATFQQQWTSLGVADTWTAPFRAPVLASEITRTLALTLTPTLTPTPTPTLAPTLP